MEGARRGDMDELFDDEATYFEANSFVHEFAHVIHYVGIGLGSERDPLLVTADT